jgi:hypothetical protein
VSQGAWIAGALLVGFLVFIVTRGELPAYRKVIGL